MRARGGRPRAAAVALRLLCALAVLGAPATAGASPKAGRDAPGPQASAEAQKLFARGRELYLAGKHAEALGLLERSYHLLPSPNSLLLVARCLRELGRLVEAVHRFDATVAASGGDARYAKAAESAREEGSALRALLAVLRVTVTEAAPGTLVELGDQRVPLGPDGRAELLHRSGDVVLAVRAPTGATITRTLRLESGETTSLELSFDAPRPAPASSPPTASRPAAPLPAPPGDERPPSWARPAGLAAAGVGVVGLAAFAGFGLRSLAIYDGLDARCAPLCGEAERAEADRGRTAQTLANVGLAVGVAGLATGVTLFALGGARDGAGARARSALLVASPLRIEARGAF